MNIEKWIYVWHAYDDDDDEESFPISHSDIISVCENGKSQSICILEDVVNKRKK